MVARGWHDDAEVITQHGKTMCLGNKQLHTTLNVNSEKSWDHQGFPRHERSTAGSLKSPAYSLARLGE